MPVLFLNILKLIFIALIYLFLWQVARAIAAHLGGVGAEPSSRRRAGGELVVVRSESQAGLHFSVRDVAVVGRSPEADVMLEDAYASEFHMRLVAKDGRLVLHDLGSTNGTYVNGRRVTSPLALNRGDAVQIGKTVLEVR
jgi:pSer/pThr/pTyr-binding forkhead associated (FHA) protein